MPLSSDDAASWLHSPEHRAWLTGQALRLLEFFRATVDGAGTFVELDDDARPLPTGCPPALAPRQNLLTVARAIHCYAAGELLGIPGCHALVASGLATVWNEHRDPESGGYIAAVGRAGGPDDTTKAAYGHAHVLLAASAALSAGHTGARALFDDVLAVIDAHFWSDEDGAASAEDFDRDWHALEPYRGVNSNMHLCESLLAAADAASRPDLAERARRLVGRFVSAQARAHGWLLPEHYDTSWQPMLEYNRDRIDDPFRPYGATVGHSLEWARLVLCSGLATGELSSELVEMSEAMFAKAVEVGWDTAAGGLVYTVSWDGAPVNRDRYWWPIAEGIATASYLARVTGKAGYEEWYRRFWEFAAEYLIDHARGGWYPQLSEHNIRKCHPWYGKPDIYHTLQACLLPQLPVAASLMGAVRGRG
jgi:sulfoquinovose isomerase